MKRKVVYARLQAGDAFIPGIGNLAKTSTLNSGEVVRGVRLEMYDLGDKGLEINIVRAGKETLVSGIPSANIQIVLYANEDGTSPDLRVVGNVS